MNVEIIEEVNRMPDSFLEENGLSVAALMILILWLFVILLLLVNK